MTSKAQQKMEAAEAHRDELNIQIVGFWDAGSEPPKRLRRLAIAAQDELDRAKDAVRAEARRAT